MSNHEIARLEAQLAAAKAKAAEPQPRYPLTAGQILLVGTVAEEREGRPSPVYVNAERTMASVQVVCGLPVGNGRLYIDVVGWGDLVETIATLEPGDEFKALAYIESNKSPSTGRWFIRAVAEKIQRREAPKVEEPQVTIFDTDDEEAFESHLV